jgi:predicted ribosomally synthesized peptide with nif11-like leader
MGWASTGAKKLSRTGAMPIGYVKDTPMKTLAEFIQRLQDEPEFEKRAQAFDNGEDLMAFVQSEGYDFTLEELAIEFKRGAQGRTEADAPAPASREAGGETGGEPQEAVFPGPSEALPPIEPATARPRRDGAAETRGHPPAPLPQREPEGESPEAAPRIGGRHRGFSSQRLKSVSGEDA